MRSTFIVATTVLAMWMGYAYPFLAVFRGARLWPVVARVWGVLLVYMLLLCFGLPLVVTSISHEFGREMLNSWVPEGPAVVGVAVMGWVPPALAGGIGYVVRRAGQRFFPHRMAKMRTNSQEEAQPRGGANRHERAGSRLGRRAGGGSPQSFGGVVAGRAVGPFAATRAWRWAVLEPGASSTASSRRARLRSEAIQRVQFASPGCGRSTRVVRPWYPSRRSCW